MSGESTLTVIGHTTAPAELRFTPSGAACASWTLAVTERRFDKQAQEFKDVGTIFYRCTAWREMAENVAESLTDKGMRVIVKGNLRVREYETRDGVKGTSIELDVDEVGPILRNATAAVRKTQRANGGGGAGGQAQADPWASSGPSNDTEPPF